ATTSTPFPYPTLFRSEAVGAHAAGRMTEGDLRALEDRACPGAGACGGQFTANTMSTAISLLGIAPLSGGDVPATDPRKPEVAREAGRAAVRLIERGVTARQILSRTAVENAVVGVAATGGSTNAVLHLLAIAREAGVPLTIDEFDALSERTPVIADLKPGGRYTAVDLERAGGTALVARRL